MRKLYWHIHHDTLLEEATEPIEKRIDFIKANKDDAELRLRLLKPVKNQKLVDSAQLEYRKIEQSAWAECFKIRRSADVEYSKIEQLASAVYEKIEQSAEAKKEEIIQHARISYEKTIRDLHDSECPNCPWKNARIEILG